MPCADVPSLFATLTPKQKSDKPLISEGDCGVVFRVDGTAEIFSTGVSPLLSDPQKWGEKELKQVEMGKKLMAISIALQNDQLMAILYDVASGVIDAEQAQDAIRH